MDRPPGAQRRVPGLPTLLSQLLHIVSTRFATFEGAHSVACFPGGGDIAGSASLHTGALSGTALVHSGEKGLRAIFLAKNRNFHLLEYLDIWTKPAAYSNFLLLSILAGSFILKSPFRSDRSTSNTQKNNTCIKRLKSKKTATKCFSTLGSKTGSQILVSQLILQ